MVPRPTPRHRTDGIIRLAAPALVGQEPRRLPRLSKEANEAHRGDGVRLKERRDGMPLALDLKALNGLVLVKVLETSGAAHPDDAALHFGGHQAPGMTVARYI